MAIDCIRSVFSDATVSWERTARVPEPIMRITNEDVLVHEFPQNDMSDDLRGPGVDELLEKLKALQTAGK